MNTHNTLPSKTQPAFGEGYDGDVMFYDDVNSERRKDIDLYRELLSEETRSILDVACGTGQVTRGLAEGRARVVGIDSSAGMLARARAHRSDNIEFELGDMAGWDIGERFDAVTCTFNSLQHLLTLDELLRFFASARAHLHPSGRLFFDIQCPHFDFLSFRRTNVFRFTFHSGILGQSVDLFEDSAYNRATQVNTIDYSYRLAGVGTELFRHRFQMRQIFPQELQAVLKLMGFKVICIFGGVDRRPLDTKALQQIVVCTPA